MSIFKRSSKSKTPEGRNLSQDKQAPVFSYYASQPSSTSNRARHTGNKGSQKTLAKTLRNLPIIIALLTIIISVVYASTVDSNKPIVKIVSTSAAGSVSTDTYTDALANYLSQGLSNKSKLLINTKNIEERFKQDFPEIDDVVITIPLVSRRPVIAATLEEPALIVGTSSGGYVLNHQGRVFSRSNDLPSVLLNNVPIVEDQAGITFTLGEIAVPSDLVTFITDINRQSLADDLSYDRLVLPTVANELHATPKEETFYIKYNTERDVRSQVGSYLATIKQLKEQGTIPKEYADVRIAERIYVK